MRFCLRQSRSLAGFAASPLRRIPGWEAKHQKFVILCRPAAQLKAETARDLLEHDNTAVLIDIRSQSTRDEKGVLDLPSHAHQVSIDCPSILPSTVTHPDVGNWYSESQQ